MSELGQVVLAWERGALGVPSPQLRAMFSCPQAPPVSSSSGYSATHHSDRGEKIAQVIKGKAQEFPKSGACHQFIQRQTVGCGMTYEFVR